MSSSDKDSRTVLCPNCGERHTLSPKQAKEISNAVVRKERATGGVNRWKNVSYEERCEMARKGVLTRKKRQREEKKASKQ